MDKNKKLIQCIIGSITLALLNSEIFTTSKFGIFHGGNFVSQIIFWVSSILSLVCVILMTIYAILLIVNNIDIRHKKIIQLFYRTKAAIKMTAFFML